ncbi:uncharacterized protein BJ212DRAFT_1302538 [Suillus subaureus]|uniref:Uncharacterized protein n=1 Tax=Suillus subaureus TaxID=48587 RepID=A0A9P7E2J6_9AGAM|nr:uncharacterized protein BJ212DRAFT_1302538 [Suillus subaureus]KAG1809289.1 hypothetical protein BJ212DRAFT_1302538 [Suillus subaureus]
MCKLQFSNNELLTQKCHLKHDKAETLASLDQHHQKELADLQNQMVLGLQDAQREAQIEQDAAVAEREALFQQEANLAREKLLAEKEAELSCLTAEYRSKVALLDAPDTNSESESDKESQTGIQGNAESPLSAILGNVPIQNSTIGMLAEALTKVLQTPEVVSHRAARLTWEKKKPFIKKFTDLQHRDNKANI